MGGVERKLTARAGHAQHTLAPQGLILALHFHPCRGVEAGNVAFQNHNLVLKQARLQEPGDGVQAQGCASGKSASRTSAVAGVESGTPCAWPGARAWEGLAKSLYKSSEQAREEGVMCRPLRHRGSPDVQRTHPCQRG